MNSHEDNPLLSVQSLGNVQITFGGRSVTLKMSKAAVLLVYLMRHGGVAHGREQLAALLWPEESQAKTQENFRQALYQMRRIFGDRQTADRYLTVNQKTIQFRADSLHTLDANLLEQCVAEKAWQRALELYAGEFLATFYPAEAQELGEWQALTREHLHQLAVFACTQLARQLEKSDPARTAHAARRLLALEPWAEEGHRLLMRWWAAQGQPAEALAQYQSCVAILSDELGINPAPETTALYEQIRDGRLAPPATLAHNLPALLTPLIGRQQELATLQRYLAATDNRLLTLVGPGGVGKTKLMVALGWAAVHDPPPVPFTAIYFISLAELEPAEASHLPEQIISHLLTTLGIHLSPTTPYQTILAERWGDRPILLLLDNWEHLTAAAGLLTTWLAAMPNLHIVTTSREPLGLYGETILPLGGLEQGLDNAAAADEAPAAGRLFVQCARRVQPRFQWDAKTAPLIRGICRALDGHPLALEMAAAWLQGLTLAEVADGVAEGLDLLTSSHADTLPRQRDMRRLLAQSWQKLTGDQQRILAQLALFRQSFTPAQAHAVAGCSRIQLALVVANSWLRRTDNGRYQFHELLRHYAHEQLVAQPSLHQQARRAYMQEHLQYLQSQRDLLEANPSSDLFVGLRQRHADLEQAWTWASGEGWQAEIIATVRPLACFYLGSGLLSDGIRLLEETIHHLRRLPATPQRQRALAHVLVEQAGLRNLQVNCELIPAAMVEAIALAQPVADEALLIRAYTEYGIAVGRLGRLAEGRDLLRAGLALAVQSQDWERAAMIRVALGNIDQDEGLIAASIEHYHQALQWCEQLDKPIQLNNVRHNLAIALTHLGQYTRARRLHQQNLASWRRLERQSNLAMTLEGLGYVALAQNRLTLAELHLHTALRLYDELEDLDGVAYTHLYLGHGAVARGMLSAAATHYRAMIGARQRLGHIHLLNQGWAGLADVAQRRGQLLEAMAYVDRCWPAILTGQVQGEEPMPVYLTCYEVLAAVGDERAAAVLEQALSQLNRQLVALGSDELASQTFMQAVPSHRALFAAAAQQSVSPESPGHTNWVARLGALAHS